MSTPVKFEMDPDILEACKRYIEIGEFESLSDIVSYCLRQLRDYLNTHPLPKTSIISADNCSISNVRVNSKVLNDLKSYPLKQKSLANMGCYIFFRENEIISESGEYDLSKIN